MNRRLAPSVRTLIPAEIKDWIPALAELRVRVFRDFPYCYDGRDNQAYERDYLAHYAASSNAVVVIAEDDNSPVGCTTGLPLTDGDGEFIQPFERAGIDPSRVFYFGESVLLPEYRGLGIGHRFFDLREAHARTLGYAVTAFCAVDREDDDPRRPSDYRPLDPFWKGRGYVRHPEMQSRFDWREVGSPEERAHTLTFWIRALA